MERDARELRAVVNQRVVRRRMSGIAAGREDQPAARAVDGGEELLQHVRADDHDVLLASQHRQCGHRHVGQRGIAEPQLPCGAGEQRGSAGAVAALPARCEPDTERRRATGAHGERGCGAQ
jgi:hypothetical protein